MSQNLFYPPGLGPSGGSASTGTNGAPAPTSSTEVGGINPSGNLQPLLTDASGNLFVNVAAGSITAENPSVSLTSALVPTYATYVGMNVSGDLVGLQGTANGLKVDGSAVTQPISAVSLPLPTGAATNAELVTINTTLGSPFQAGGSIGNTAFGISGSLPAGSNAIGSVSVSNFPATQPVSGTVAVSNFPATQAISAVSLPLPTGAATNAELVTINTTLGSPFQAGGSIGNSSFGISGSLPAGSNAIGSVSVSNFPATQAISAASLPLPTGAATSANQTNASQKTQIVDGSGNVIAATSNALNVNVQNSISQTIAGTASANAPVYNVYSSTNITTSAYVQLVASTSNVINTVHIFDSSGQAMIFAVGGSGSEVIQLYVPPGGDTFTLHIPAGSRIAYKALTATASAGYLLMSFLE